MKITSAWIDDPSLEGEVTAPKLCVEVTEKPDVTIPDEPFAGGWTVGKYGPFVKYVCATAKVDAGDFNVRFRTRFPVVVDIQLFVGPEDEKGISGYSLPLSRARQLVRKHDDNWRLLVSDKAAEQGSLLWVPVETNPSCRFWTGRATCKTRPTQVVRVKNVNLPLCSAHLQEHNAQFAEKRAESRNAS